MNKPFFHRLVSLPHLVQRTATCFISAGLLVNLLLPCQAQINSLAQADRVQKGTGRNPYDQESSYLLNDEAIKHQLKGLLKSLSHLSVVDPATYALIQGNLHAYVHQLAEEQVDYGNQDLCRAVQLRLFQFDDQIKAALVENRRMAHEEGPLPDKMEKVPKGARVAVRPYALLFNKPDHQSTLRHIISPKETVTVLKDRGSYCLVRCALHKGYLSKGMIVAYRL